MWISLCHILYPVSVHGAGIRISEITTFPFVCLHLFNSDLLILDMIVLALDLQLYHNILIVFWLKILWRGLDLGKCKSISERKRLPIFVSTFLLYGGLYQMMFCEGFLRALVSHCGIPCMQD